MNVNVTSSPPSAMTDAVSVLSGALATAERAFYTLPGSSVVARYVKSSHRDDPGRTLLEVLLVLFVVRTWLQSRTRTERAGKHFIQFAEKEIEDLVDEWVPEPLCESLNEAEEAELAAVPIIAGPQGPKPKLAHTGKTTLNLASFNFTGLAGNEACRQRALDTLRTYGVGSCGPAGFYGTLDVHLALERDIADFLGTEAAILYSQGYSTISSVIPAFCKRGDIIVADRGVTFAIQQGINISRSTVRWYDHNDPGSLEATLQAVDKERKKKKWPLTRRFIITEGIFEKDGQMVDLPKLIELKNKYKYRLILDESFSFGTVGRTGRGLTELYNVPASQVDMIIGSVATSLAAGGGFCAGSHVVVDHQRINGAAFVFSASMPGLLATSASEGISILRSTPSLLSALQDNVRAVRAVLDAAPHVHVPSHAGSPLIHLTLAAPLGDVPAPLGAFPPPGPAQIAAPGPLPFDIAAEDAALQAVADECLAQGVLVVRATRLRGQEMVEARPSLRLAISAALTRKECEKAALVIKAACAKVLAKRK